MAAGGKVGNWRLQPVYLLVDDRLHHQHGQHYYAWALFDAGSDHADGVLPQRGDTGIWSDGSRGMDGWPAGGGLPGQ